MNYEGRNEPRTAKVERIIVRYQGSPVVSWTVSRANCTPSKTGVMNHAPSSETEATASVAGIVLLERSMEEAADAEEAQCAPANDAGKLAKATGRSGSLATLEKEHPKLSCC